MAAFNKQTKAVIIMYNWDDPINEALNKPEPKISEPKTDNLNEPIIQVDNMDSQEGLTGIENIEKGASRI